MSTTLAQSCISLGYRVHPVPQFPQLSIRHRNCRCLRGGSTGMVLSSVCLDGGCVLGLLAGACRALLNLCAPRSLLHLLLHADWSLRATGSVSSWGSVPFCPEILPLFADLFCSLCARSSHFMRDTLTHCAQRKGSASSALPRNLSIKPPSSRSPLGPSTCTS